MPDPDFADVAIVGAGFAGSVLAMHLAARAGPGLRVALFDATGAGPGTAYATPVRGHLMNGPIRAMSAVPGDDDHLMRRLPGEPGERFIARRAYGAYLSELTGQARSKYPNLRFVRRDVVAIVPGEGEYVLRDAEGCAWRTGCVVLALGNARPGSTFLPDELRCDPRYDGDPWHFTGAGVRGEVLCIGSGLTAMDVLVSLHENGFTGRVHLVSRHGLVPQVDDPRVRGLDPDALRLDPSSPGALLRTLRRAAREAAAGGGDWRGVVEAIRRRSPEIWMGWDLRARRRFLRHLQAYWSVHRYRMPAETAALYATLEVRGAVVRHRGAIRAARAEDDGVRVVIERAGRREELVVQHVVNCTGPESDYLRIDRPLVRDLLRRGLVRPDALRLGIDATPSMQVIGAHGSPWPRLFTLGPPLRGLWYESTGVPEIRDQAARLTHALLAGGHVPRSTKTEPS